MHSPLTKEDIVKLIPDLILLESGQMSWDQVGRLLNEDLRAVRHLQAVEIDGRKVSAVDDPWRMVKEEMFLFAATEDAAYDPLRDELARNGGAGPAYLLPLFSAWLSLKTGYPVSLVRTMTGAVMWGLVERDSEHWQEIAVVVRSRSLPPC